MNALQRRLAAVAEHEALARYQLADDVGHDDLPADCFIGQKRGDDDGRAEEVAVLGDRFAGVDADTQVQRLAAG